MWWRVCEFVKNGLFVMIRSFWVELIGGGA